MEVVRGSGNVFRDLGHEDADVKQCKAILAAEIIKALGRQAVRVRAGHDRTRIASADFSRIRNANLGRITVDRLISILNELCWRVELRIKLQPLMVDCEEVKFPQFKRTASRRSPPCARRDRKG